MKVCCLANRTNIHSVYPDQRRIPLTIDLVANKAASYQVKRAPGDEPDQTCSVSDVSFTRVVICVCRSSVLTS